MAQVSSNMQDAERQKITQMLNGCGLHATEEAINTIAYGIGTRENTFLGYQYKANAAMEMDYLESVGLAVGSDNRPEHIINSANQRAPSMFSGDKHYAPELLNRISYLAAKEYQEFKVGETQPGNKEMWRLATLANGAKIAANSYGLNGRYLGSIGMPTSGEDSVSEAANSSLTTTDFYLPYERQKHREAFYKSHLVKEVDSLTDPAIDKSAHNVALAITPRDKDPTKDAENLYRNEQAIREMNAQDVSKLEKMLAETTETNYSVLDTGLSIDGSGISRKDNNGLTFSQDKLRSALEGANRGIIEWDKDGKLKGREDYRKVIEEYLNKNGMTEQIQAIQQGKKPQSASKAAPIEKPKLAADPAPTTPRPAVSAPDTAASPKPVAATAGAPTPVVAGSKPAPNNNKPPSHPAATPPASQNAQTQKQPQTPSAAAPQEQAAATIDPKKNPVNDPSMILFMNQLGITGDAERNAFAEQHKGQLEGIHDLERNLQGFDPDGKRFTGPHSKNAPTLANTPNLLIDDNNLTGTKRVAVKAALQEQEIQQKDANGKYNGIFVAPAEAPIMAARNKAGLTAAPPWKADASPAENRAIMGQTPRQDRLPQAQPGENINYASPPPANAGQQPSQTLAATKSNWDDNGFGWGDQRSGPGSGESIQSLRRMTPPTPKQTGAAVASRGSSLPGQGNPNQRRNPNEVTKNGYAYHRTGFSLRDLFGGNDA